MRLAYLILAHKNPLQLSRLFRALYHTHDYFALHVDRKAPPEVHQDATALAEKHPNVRIVRPHSVTWGGWSLTDATLAGLETLLEMGAWDFAFNLSGQDYPTQSRQALVSFLESRRTQSFIETIAVNDSEPLRINRLIHYHLETRRRVYRLPIRRRLSWTPCWGSSWIAPNRELTEFFVRDRGLAKMKRFFRHTSNGDENFFQMAAMRSPFRATIEPRNLHFIEWGLDERGNAPEHPRTLTDVDLPRILAAKNCFFARKFEDEEVLNKLDRQRRHPGGNS